jgi:hypothetical protein
MSKPLTVLLCVSWWLLVATDRTYAYLDPASGSMMLQLLLGGAAGVAVVMRLYWRQLLALFGIDKKEKLDSLGEASQATTPPEPANGSNRQREPTR